MRKRYWWTIPKPNKVDLRAALIDIVNRNVHFSLCVFNGELMIFHKDCKIAQWDIGGFHISEFLVNQYCSASWRFFNLSLSTFDYEIKILTDGEFKRGYD